MNWFPAIACLGQAILLSDLDRSHIVAMNVFVKDVERSVPKRGRDDREAFVDGEGVPMQIWS